MQRNWIYTSLILVAILLIFATIGLQIVLLSGQQLSGFTAGLRQAQTNQIPPVTATPAAIQNAEMASDIDTTQVALALFTPTNTSIVPPTNTPIVIVLQPTPEPLTPAPPPTATPSPTGPPTTEPPTPTSTATTQPATTETLQPSAQSSADLAPVDLRLGYLPQRTGCAMVTEIVARVLTETYGYRVGTTPFDSAEALHRHVAHEGDEIYWADLTLCHAFPDDGNFLQQFGSHLKIMGDALVENEGQRWHVLTFSGLYRPLRTDARCVYEFLENLTFTEIDFQEPDAAAWLANHAPQVESWIGCVETE